MLMMEGDEEEEEEVEEPMADENHHDDVQVAVSSEVPHVIVVKEQATEKKEAVDVGIKKPTTAVSPEQRAYRDKYKSLKSKVKRLLFEQECFNEDLRKAQRKLLRVNRDKSFLLDRLLQYEAPDFSSSDDSKTDSSDEDDERIINAEDPPSKAEAAGGLTNGKKHAKLKHAQAKELLKKKKKKEAGKSEKVRCREVDKAGRHCPKLVSRKIRSGWCYKHRQMHRRQAVPATTATESSSGRTAGKLKAAKSETSAKTSNLSGAFPRMKPVGEQTSGVGGGVRANEENSENELNDDGLVIDVP